LQSVPTAHVVKKGSSEYSDPGPPSSHSPSEAVLHVFEHTVCALVKPTIMATTMMRVF
jgi:hypothetical protein